MGRAADVLLASGSFGGVVLDLDRQSLPLPLLTRLAARCARHESCLVLLSEKKSDESPSMGVGISWRSGVQRQRIGPNAFVLRWQGLKDRQGEPSGAGINRVRGSWLPMTSFKGPRRAVLQLPELALQWVFIQEPRWREKELVLSRSDHPGARVLALNETARRRRVRVHQTLAQARALAPGLITYPWPEAQLILCQERVAQWLSERVPSLALFTDEPGVFVLDVSGLEAVVGPLKAWAQALLVSLQEEKGLWGRIVLGYDPMPARVLCPQACPVLILRDPEMEQAQLAEQPLSALGLNARLQGRLAPLGLRSIGDF